ncbi:MAG: type VI secretion system baseplate subunit TssG [Nannocystaceae bacterium]|nr:type VI secretion system baseplate subunit TssG [Myxococcales bacterium]
MALERSSDDIADALGELLARARGADFYTLVDVLARWLPGEAPGGRGPASAESLRLLHDPALAFRATDVSEARARGERVELVTTFLGLTGVVSPLPSYVAEEVLQEDAQAPARRDFLDIFHHRLLSLLYRLVGKYDWSRQYVRGARDPWSQRVLALIARGDDDHFPAWRSLRLAPLLYARAPTAARLQVALADVLAPALDGATVSITQFVGAWVSFDSAQQMRLGVANTHLDSSALLGNQSYQCTSQFRVVLRPLSGESFRRFLPGGDQSRIIDAVIKAFSLDSHDYDIELVLAAGAAPPFSLAGVARSQLGLDTWLKGVTNCDTSVVVPRRRRAAPD